jgi:hypothetical protein
MLDSLLESWRDWRRRSRDAAAFKERLLAAVDDGTLTSRELAALEAMREELGLDATALGAVRAQAYERAYRAAAADGALSPGEEADLERLRALLGLSPDALCHSPHELARLRLLHALGEGHLPHIEVPGLVMRRGEVAHWSEPGALLEERVVGRRTVGGSAGVSIRVMRGVSFRVGQSRGQSIPITEVQAVSSGLLVVTSDRVTFRGDRKSFEVRWDKLLGYDFYTDGVSIVPATGKPRLVRLADARGVDVIGTLMTQLAQQG